jgi:hypothetical protein
LVSKIWKGEAVLLSPELNQLNCLAHLLQSGRVPQNVATEHVELGGSATESRSGFARGWPRQEAPY